ncbi:hypothetical protein CCMSSC00406_0002382 [Pleurotus cornucopiae]|uniref:Uncharacterized protein n=1 Tax=Pleurotus cornucopiae TaxID=5321 RepID=A0ACB7IS18_PLECO|nr:hypothetical protein CCMSSC00406_0002382 [Pleurotus cornucopiae]
MSIFNVPPPDYTSVAHEPITAPEDSVIIPQQPVVEDQQSLPLPPPSSTVHTTDTGSLVLSWNPAQLYAEPPAPITRTTSRTPTQSSEGSASRVNLARPPSPTPSENPPGYVEARIPTGPVLYTFSPFGHNCMILVPPPESQDTRPQYHISVDVDCFNPLVHITTVRRGVNEYGDHVAEFEMGISKSPATLSIRGKHYKLSEAMQKRGSPMSRSWAWQFVRHKLYWDGSKPVECKCYASPEKTTLYATFTPARRPEVRTQPIIQAQLKITPAGYPLFDDILVSALIVARCRATPQDNDLFNFQW